MTGDGVELTLVAMCAVNVEPSEFRKPVVDTKGTALASWEWTLLVRPDSACHSPDVEAFRDRSDLSVTSPGSARQAVGARRLHRRAPVPGYQRADAEACRGGPCSHEMRCPKGQSSHTVAWEHLGSVDDGLHKCDSVSTLDDSLQEGHGGRAEDVVHLSDLSHKLLLRPAHTRDQVNGSELATQMEIRIAKGLVWLWKQEQPGRWAPTDRQCNQQPG